MFKIELSQEPYITYKGQHLSISDFFKIENINKLPWVEAQVSISGIECINHEKRKTKEFPHEVFITDLDDSFYEFLLKENLETTQWKVLKYEKGDFFSKHVDKIGLYTVLLFPKDVQNLKGGELCIENEQTFKPGELLKHTILIFPVDCPHEVKEIIEGERYVIKTSLIPNGNFEVKDVEKEIDGELYDGGYYKGEPIGDY